MWSATATSLVRHWFKPWCGARETEMPSPPSAKQRRWGAYGNKPGETLRASGIARRSPATVSAGLRLRTATVGSTPSADSIEHNLIKISDTFNSNCCEYFVSTATRRRNITKMRAVILVMAVASAVAALDLNSPDIAVPAVLEGAAPEDVLLYLYDVVLTSFMQNEPNNQGRRSD
uniref:SFRICE_035050 n=1 Tax=Spodoptera frugiperda TaxID=7108 RepID=A0A2H1W5D0_SPOFR